MQQAVSGLTSTPADMFQGSGQQFTTMGKPISFLFTPLLTGACLGFEYYADPSDPTGGFITWQVAGSPSVRMGAAAVGPDTDPTVGSGVGQRLIPVEPMVRILPLLAALPIIDIDILQAIILNLGISTNWQTIDLTTMEFPAEMLVDYVRVYQRKGQTNIGCDPKGFPTSDYINRHYDSYTNPNLTMWNYQKPKNGLVSLLSLSCLDVYSNFDMLQYEGGC